MTDGDNIQWLMNSFVTNQNWWGARVEEKFHLAGQFHLDLLN